MKNLISKIGFILLVSGFAVADDCTYFCDSKEIKAIKENLRNEDTNDLLRQSIKLQQQQLELERQRQAQQQDLQNTIEQELAREAAFRSDPDKNQ